MDSTQLFQELRNARLAVNAAVLGRSEQIDFALACILAGGHLLLEDVPGVGKTTLAKTLALSLGLAFRRVQLTSDLQPADVTGSPVILGAEGIRFRPGPVFTNVLLADELNRAPEKTQSALLEAMEERQVTVDGETHRLPEPFFVIATQNPRDQLGTFEMPESQADRFAMSIELGIPDAESEVAMLRDDARPPPKEVLSLATLQAIQRASQEVQATDALLRYVQRILAATRTQLGKSGGLSPRAGKTLLRAARAWAFIGQRRYATPDDVQAVFPYVARHRLRQGGARFGADEAKQLLQGVSVE